jgi:hypothetical protein
VFQENYLKNYTFSTDIFQGHPGTLVFGNEQQFSSFSHLKLISFDPQLAFIAVCQIKAAKYSS